MNNSLNDSLSLLDICQELGLSPEFLVAVAAESTNYYQTFERRKRDGGMRPIAASQGALKSIQRSLLDNLLTKVELPEHVHGCVKGRSIASNASKHINREVVLNIDLSNFFSMVNIKIVQSIFQKRFNCDLEASVVLSEITTLNGSLPQGAPTSPVLANFAALALDQALMEICRAVTQVENYGYTRYVDDITISGATKLIDILPEIYSAIDSCGFKANLTKTKILRQSTRQWVTGLVVNKKLNPPRNLVRRIRQDLYYCGKYGLNAHCEWRGVLPNNFLIQIRGRIGYVGMTQPELARQFFKELLFVAPTLEMSMEESTLRKLKVLIDRERLATITYLETQHRVAPSQINISADGAIVLRAFQLSPEQGWTVYTLSEITTVEEYGDSL